jgi:hypothetical protein
MNYNWLSIIGPSDGRSGAAANSELVPRRLPVDLIPALTCSRRLLRRHLRRWQRYTGKTATLDHTQRTFEDIESERTVCINNKAAESVSSDRRSPEVLR